MCENGLSEWIRGTFGKQRNFPWNFPDLFDVFFHKENTTHVFILGTWYFDALWCNVCGLKYNVQVVHQNKIGFSWNSTNYSLNFGQNCYFCNLFDQSPTLEFVKSFSVSHVYNYSLRLVCNLTCWLAISRWRAKY